MVVAPLLCVRENVVRKGCRKETLHYGSSAGLPGGNAMGVALTGRTSLSQF